MSYIDFKKGVIALAPLAGFTDRPFRKIAKQFGVDITYSEMISSNALVYNSDKTFKMLQKNSNETPYIVQLAGSDSDIIKKAVLILNEIDGIDGIDLNCGCPVPKIISQNAGSALLKDLDNLKRLVSTIKKYSNKKYTSIKTRIGFSKKIPSLIANALQDSGVDFVAVHGRTRSGGYKSKIDYEAIGEFVKTLKIPVIANGDITSYEIAQDVMRTTGTNSIMIGRGSIGKPWIFYQLKQKSDKIPNDIVLDVILSHYDAMIEFYGEIGMKMFRKHLHDYSKRWNNSSAFRDTINRIDDIQKSRDEIEHFFSHESLIE